MPAWDRLGSIRERGKRNLPPSARVRPYEILMRGDEFRLGPLRADLLGEPKKKGPWLVGDSQGPLGQDDAGLPNRTVGELLL